MNNDIRKVTWGATLVGIVGVLIWIDRYTSGLIGGYFTFLLPLPLVLYSAKYGLKDSLVPYSALLIMTFLISPLTMVFTVGCCGITGAFYGYGVYSKKSTNWLLGITVFFTAISYFITTYLFASAFGINIQDEIDFLVQTLGTGQTALPLGFSLEEFIRAVYPIAMIAAAVMEAMIIHMISYLLLKRLKFSVSKLQPLQDIKIPRWLGVILSVSMFLPVYINVLNLPSLLHISYAICTMCSLIFLLNGYISAAWLYRYFTNGRMGVLFNVSLVLLSFYFPLLLLLIIALGALEMCIGLKDSLLKRRQ